MNSNSQNKYFYQNEKIIYSNNNQKKIPYKVINSSRSYKSDNQDNKNLQYFPIETKDSLSGKHTIYLATENNEKTKDFIPINKNRKIFENFNKKIIKKRKNKNRVLLPQKSIELQIQKTKFEYLINSLNKDENEKNLFSDNEKSKKSNKSVQMISSYDMINHKNKNDYKNIKNDFISTTKNILDTSKVNKNKGLAHSFSVDNYSDILNNSVSNYTDNLENTKMIDKNFIGRIRNPKRKNNLMKMLEKYQRYKSLSKVNINNPLDNTITFGLGFDRIEQEKSRQKSTERLYNMKNNDNIIVEDENENSENETIKRISNSKKNDNINNNNSNNINNNDDKKNQNLKENIINYKNEKIINLENVEKLFKKKNIEKKQKNKIKNKSIDSIIHSENREINRRKEIYQEIKKYNNKNNCIHNINDIDANVEYFDKNNSNQNIYHEKYNKNLYNKKVIKNNILQEKKENNNDLNNNIISNINNMNNKIEINRNIINKTKKPKNSPQKILVRKILREERYIIDENGQEKVLEINQALLNDNNFKNNINKNPEIYLKNLNKINNINYNNIKEEIMKKERYHRKNRNILISDKNLDALNNLQKKYIKNKNDYSLNISNRISNDKIKRNNTAISPIYKISKNNSNYNSSKKEKRILENLKFSKLNKPIIIKKMDKLIQRNSPDSNIYRNQYQNINISNNLNHVIYIQNQTSPNRSQDFKKYQKPYQILKNEHQKKSDNNNNKNHSYHEITSVNNRKINSTSKTIYHDYSNLDKRIILNKSSANIHNYNGNYNLSNNVIVRNYSNNNFDKPIKTSRRLILENMGNYNNNENNKLERKFLIDNSMEKNFKVYKNKDNAVIYGYSRNQIRNKILKKENPTDYNENIIKRYTNRISSIKYTNSITNRNLIHNHLNKYKNNSQSMTNIYHWSNNSFNKNQQKINVNQSTKSNFSINEHISYK